MIARLAGRRALFALALASALASGAIYAAGAQRANVVVAARDLDALRPLEADDLVVRAFPTDGVPAGSLPDARPAIGRRLRAPLAAGQLVLRAVLTDDAALFQTGLLPPSGTRALALPVSASQALGGAVIPGARVDVIAVPASGRAPAGRVTELIAANALVLDVRSEAGAPFVRAAAPKALAAGAAERIGSVVVAIPVRDELRAADRIATSTFVLVLSRSCCSE